MTMFEQSPALTPSFVASQSGQIRSKLQLQLLNLFMKVSVHFANLNARASWQRMIEAELSRLESLGEIVSARARVERHHEVRPAFKVTAFLEVPGPDFHAEAADHTLPAAVLKLVAILERRMKSRKRQQMVRHKAHGQLRAPLVCSSAIAVSRP